MAADPECPESSPSVPGSNHDARARPLVLERRASTKIRWRLRPRRPPFLDPDVPVPGCMSARASPGTGRKQPRPQASVPGCSRSTRDLGGPSRRPPPIALLHPRRAGPRSGLLGPGLGKCFYSFGQVQPVWVEEGGGRRGRRLQGTCVVAQPEYQRSARAP